MGMHSNKTKGWACLLNHSFAVENSTSVECICMWVETNLANYTAVLTKCQSEVKETIKQVHQRYGVMTSHWCRNTVRIELGKWSSNRQIIFQCRRLDCHNDIVLGCFIPVGTCMLAWYSNNLEIMLGLWCSDTLNPSQWCSLVAVLSLLGVCYWYFSHLHLLLLWPMSIIIASGQNGGIHIIYIHFDAGFEKWTPNHQGTVRK